MSFSQDHQQQGSPQVSIQQQQQSISGASGSVQQGESSSSSTSSSSGGSPQAQLQASQQQQQQQPLAEATGSSLQGGPGVLGSLSVQPTSPPQLQQQALSGSDLAGGSVSSASSSSLFKSYPNVAWNGPYTGNTVSNQWSSRASQALVNSNPWSSLSNPLGGHTKKPVPNFHVISPMKKSTPNMSQQSMISSSMAGAMGNGSSNPLDNLRYPLEQQLLEIMRNASGESQDHFKGM